MKCCKRCNIEKPYSEYYRYKRSKDGYEYNCKVCAKLMVDESRKNNWELYVKRQSKQTKLYRQSKQLSYWIVYLLPKHNYVGKTNNPYYRMANHRKDGRDTSGWIELHRFDTEKEALTKEAEYHLAGYEGIQLPHKNKIYNGK